MPQTKKIVAFFLSVFLLLPSQIFAAEKRIPDDKLIEMLDTTLEKLPERIRQIDPKIRRIAFYSLKVDRSNITLPLFRQMHGKIESTFLKVERPILIYTPEIKPLKVVSKEDSISFISGFQSTEEIKDIATRLRLDGFLEGEVYVTSKTLYLNLRIFEADNMSIVWSEEFTSSTPLPPPVKKLTGIDYGVGLAGIPVAGTASSTALTVPSYSKYYSFDLRISQRTIRGDKVRFTLTGGLLYLYGGVEGASLEPSIVTKGGLGIKFYTRIGLRLSLLPVSSSDPNRDWIASEISYGRLFGLGASGVNTFGVKFESDLTKNITLSAGVTYVPITEVTVASNSIVKVGGLAYELSLLRLNYKP